ncbi:hypothetical protein [Actinoplanes sp. NPDC020271]|uniref:hypothetical protein n=1 Tax=Actinoplanes sp. NPDC020271 TaxID=3363896 RepID=UPI00379B2A2E
MTGSTPPGSPARPEAAARLDLDAALLDTLFARFFDDAALFPPGNAPMADAVPAHRRALAGPHGDLLGPFVIPAARLASLDGPPLDIALIIAPASLDELPDNPGPRVVAVETPVAADKDQTRFAVRTMAATLAPEVTRAIELPRTSARDEVLDALAGTGVRAKLRTGGLRADLFPTVDELAATIRACAERDIAFKCTAGLHHAIRHTDPATGFEHHGFLNVLLAAADPADAEAQLHRTDAATMAAELRAWTPSDAARVRSIFTSFGTCDVAEPVHDLAHLGLLPERIIP